MTRKESRYDRQVRAARPPVAEAAPPAGDCHEPVALEPVALWAEDETLPDGRVGRVGTVIVKNGECPYACVMCGYWTDASPTVPSAGEVAAQVARALDRLDALDPARPLDGVKLYNGSSLFEPRSLPLDDLPAIAARCARYRWVTTECRADLALERLADIRAFARVLAGTRSGDRLVFAQQKGACPLPVRGQLPPGPAPCRGTARLEIAIGLEAADDRLRAILNRREPLARFDRAVAALTDAGIAVKAFILVKPPFVSEGSALDLARRTVDYARDRGVGTVALIPTVPTPGLSQRMAEAGHFRPCDLRTLAAAVEYALDDDGRPTRGRVLVDLEHLARLPGCPDCRQAITAGLAAVNLGLPWTRPACTCHDDWQEKGDILLFQPPASMSWAELLGDMT